MFRYQFSPEIFGYTLVYLFYPLLTELDGGQEPHFLVEAEESRECSQPKLQNLFAGPLNARGDENVLEGSLAVQPLSRNLAGFDTYFKSLGPSHGSLNPWFEDAMKEYCRKQYSAARYRSAPIHVSCLAQTCSSMQTTVHSALASLFFCRSCHSSPFRQVLQRFFRYSSFLFTFHSILFPFSSLFPPI
jgi:hypothetical protein